MEDEPTSPVSRDETVTNMNPNKTISAAPRMFIRSEWAIRIAATSTITPSATHFSEMSRSVRGTAWATSTSRRPPKSATPARRLRQMVGMARTRLISPPAVTAPAPI